MKKKTTNEKQQVDEWADAKSKLLIELGQEVYLSYRRNEDFKSIVAQKGESIKELDAKIYSLLQETRQYQADVMECSCGAPITEEDVFCPECGKKTDILTEQDQQSMAVCSSCGNQVPDGADYCQACGVKMEKVYSN
ncbi:Double zinc ribbon [Lentibacillus halodurans]|uniref:Double zinc ribbon n=1 Tax=Lentibacillus halodurans TaxID=237679 RepID=A0A1I0WI16_9BACI|nr:zinc ribbon domain-containing protein [Lentibacillus halodurans]SFA87878.1 Double zinc ribbon [Lentibacillus halodurans]